MARLGDICTLVNGYAFKPTDWKTEGLPIIRIQNLNDTTAPFNYFEGEIDRKYVVNDGDLLFSWSGTPGTSFGAFFWRRGKGVLNQHIFNVYPVDGISKAYLRYALNGNISRIIDKAHGGVGLQHITKKELVEIDIPILSEDQQKKIVSVLDSVDRLIALRKEQLAKLDQLVKSRFIELFGDPETNPKGFEKVLLSDIAEYFNGLTYSPDNVTNAGIVVLRSSNIQNSQLDFTDTVRVSGSIKEKFFVRDNDILMCSRNGSARLVGKVALIKNLSEPMTFGAFMMIIRSKYYPYLMTYFQMDAFRRQILTGATTTINQITGNMLNKISLPLPKMADTNEFAAFVEQTDKSKLAIQQSLDKLELLKKSLMQEYFG